MKIGDVTLGNFVYLVSSEHKVDINGDVITDLGYEVYKRPVKVISVYSGGIHYKSKDERFGSIFVSSESLEPIPITVDFLKFNDFVETTLDKDYTQKVTGYDWVMRWCENYWVAVKQVRANLWKIYIQGDSANLDGGVTSVHDLQNKMKFCGIDKHLHIENLWSHS